ncbi:MAG: hypothetical protein HYR88_02985 [Verrucomicrobia bacterium]|nr:hypothetical protein [Verrucomicrobiota bacterium]
MNPASRSLEALFAVLMAFAGRGEALAAASYASTVLAQEPLAYWRFNDGVAVPRPDIAQNLGSLGPVANGVYSGATHPTPGALVSDPDTAARMVGGQSVRIPWSSDLNPSSAFSAEGWFRPAGPAGLLPLCVMSSGHFAIPRSGWVLYQTGSGFSFRLYAEQGGAPSLNLSGGGAPTPGAWYHVVMVYDGAAAALYVNGVSVAEGRSTGFVPAVDGDLTIGIRSDNSLEWSGDADEIGFYGGALTALQVSAHYAVALHDHHPKPYAQTILADAPLGYWRLGEAAFAFDVADNSGSSGDALNGAYRGGALNTLEAPKAPDFLGFEDGNTAASFDGREGYVTIAQGVMNGRTRYTLSGWLRREFNPAPLSGLWGQNDLFEFGFPDADTLQVWTDGGLNIPNPFPNGRWSHVAIVSEGPRLLLYTNGALAATRSQGPSSTNGFAFNIGGGGVFDGGGDFFSGQIDELALFEKPLSAAQVCNQYYSAVPKAPEIFREPEPVVLFAGFTVRASLEVCGSPDLQYQWFKSPDVSLESQTNADLALWPAVESDTGQYFVRVANLYGRTESARFQVTVLPAHPPVIERQPVAGARYAGFGFSFSATASGTLPLRYQWQRDGVDLPGSTNPTLQWTGVNVGDAGRYRVVVTNPITNVFSDEVVLDVLVPVEGSYEAELTRRRPVAYWRLDETEGDVAHDRIGGWDGRYQNATLGLPGALSGDPHGSAGFTGINSGVATSLSLSNLSSFSWLGWFRPDQAQQSGTDLMGQRDALEFGFSSSDALQARGPVLSNPFEAASFFAPGEWSFVVLQADASGLSLYGNGVLVSASVTNRAQLALSNSPFTIGMGAADASGHGFAGRVCEMAVFNRALTSEEICHLYYKAAGRPFRLDISRAPGPSGPPSTPQQMILRWSCGSIQEADNLDPLGVTAWKDRADLASPLTLEARNIRKYYRIRP